MDGLFELVFIGMLILISLLEGVTRARRQRQRQGQAPAETSEGEAEPAVQRDPRQMTRLPDREVFSKKDSESAEGLVPREIWQEIAALARGEVPTQPAPEPPAPEPIEVQRPRLPAPREATRPGPLERAPLDVARRPAAPVPPPVSPPVRISRQTAGFPEEAKPRRASPGGTPWLRPGYLPAPGMTRTDLKRLIIATEILRPPLALREPGSED